MSMAKYAYFIIIITIYLSQSVKAQVRGVIISIDDGLPVRDVNIFTDNGKKYTTNWMGEFYIYTDFKSATISHGKYLSITLTKEEMNDTIRLLPRLTTLGEVVVWGKRPFVRDKIKSWTKDAKDYGTHPSGISFNLFDLFRKKTMNKKEREKHDYIIKNY